MRYQQRTKKKILFVLMGVKLFFCFCTLGTRTETNMILAYVIRPLTDFSLFTRESLSNPWLKQSNTFIVLLTDKTEGKKSYSFMRGTLQSL